MGLRRRIPKTAAKARRFSRDLNGACPTRIARILTDRAIGMPLVAATMARGKEFTDRLFASRARAPSGEHEFDQLCTELGTELGIQHRLTPPKSPQTNGMLERFNGRIGDVLKTNRFDSALDLEQTLMRYVHRLCCTNRLMTEVTLSPGGLIQRLQ